MAVLLQLPQEHVEVAVDYYDEEHKRLLSRYPTADSIRAIVRNGIKIPTAEFLTYYLFHRKRPGLPGFRGYEEVSWHIDRALSDLSEFVCFNRGSISIPEGVGEQVPHITEYIGESIGLSVVNRIHGLTEADWSKINPLRGVADSPRFDYQVASDGINVIQVENKGSSVAINTEKSPPIYAQKARIAAKKEAIQKVERESRYPFPASVRYGTIAAVDARRGSVVKCWLLDPPSNESGLNARKLRLMNRMRFLWDWIGFLAPRSQLASALASRIAALERLSDPFELDGVPLRKGSGHPFAITPFDPSSGRHSWWLDNKSRIADGPAGGVVLPMRGEAILFLGIQEALPVLAAEQHYGAVLEYRFKTTTIRKKVECVISESRLNEFRLPSSVVTSAEKYGGYMRFALSGEIQHSPEGVVFGVLPLETHEAL